MFNSSNKLFDQIFELKFTSKQLNKQSQKCESEEKAEKVKAKKAMEKGKRDGLSGLQCLNLESTIMGYTPSSDEDLFSQSKSISLINYTTIMNRKHGRC